MQSDFLGELMYYLIRIEMDRYDENWKVVAYVVWKS